MKTALSFDDVLLVPGFNQVESRDKVSVDTTVAGLPLRLPIIASNMPSICEDEMAVAIGQLGGLGIVHRMQSIGEQVSQVENMPYKVGAAIGVGPDWVERATALVDHVDVICLDVAHGHQARVLDVALQFLLIFKDTPLIIGNIATAYAAAAFDKAIADSDQHRVALKVGVGGGSVCSTRIKTGFGVPTLQSIMDVYEVLEERQSELTIIADGGIKSSGDIVKAIAAGADAVMIGSLIAGTEETPGSVIKDDKTGLKYKVYRGAASYGAKKDYFGEADYVEGAERLVTYKGELVKVVSSLVDGVKSGLTYCGVTNLVDLRDEAEFIRVTSSGHRESMPHGLF